MLQMSFHRYLLYNNELYSGDRSEGTFQPFLFMNGNFPLIFWIFPFFICFSKTLRRFG